MKNIFTFLVFALIISTQLSAQTEETTPLEKNRSSVGLLLGLSNYQGDLVAPSIDLSESNFSAGVQYQYALNESFSLVGRFTFGKLSGDDNNYEERVDRGYSFTNNFQTLSILGKWHAYTTNALDVYLLAGPGLYFSNPEVLGVSAEALATEGEIASVGFMIPFGGGITYAFNDSWSLSLEANAAIPFSDQLDGISKLGNPDKKDMTAWFGLGVNYILGGN